MGIKKCIQNCWMNSDLKEYKRNHAQKKNNVFLCITFVSAFYKIFLQICNQRTILNFLNSQVNIF
jgi:hypothetical protein